MISKLFNGYSVRCDKEGCGLIIPFEYERSFPGLIERMKEGGWRTFKKDEKWINYCPKCAVSSSGEKDFFENRSIILDREEVEIIFRAREFFKGIHIFLESRDVLKKIICDFGKELESIEHVPDLFSKKEEEET